MTRPGRRVYQPEPAAPVVPSDERRVLASIGSHLAVAAVGVLVTAVCMLVWQPGVPSQVVTVRPAPVTVTATPSVLPSPTAATVTLPAVTLPAVTVTASGRTTTTTRTVTASGTTRTVTLPASITTTTVTTTVTTNAPEETP